MNKFDDLYFKKAAWLCEASEDDDDEDKVEEDETETDDTAEDADVEAVEEIECPDCDGTGEDEDGEECETCGGTGVIAPEESEEDIVADAEDAISDAEDDDDDDAEADPDAEPDPDEEYELDLADPVCPCCGAHLNVISDAETDTEEPATEEDVPTTEVDGFEVVDPSIMGPETNIYYSDEDAEPVEYSEDGEDDDDDVDESTKVKENEEQINEGLFGNKFGRTKHDLNEALVAELKDVPAGDRKKIIYVLNDNGFEDRVKEYGFKADDDLGEFWFGVAQVLGFVPSHCEDLGNGIVKINGKKCKSALDAYKTIVFTSEVEGANEVDESTKVNEGLFDRNKTGNDLNPEFVKDFTNVAVDDRKKIISILLESGISERELKEAGFQEDEDLGDFWNDVAYCLGFQVTNGCEVKNGVLVISGRKCKTALDAYKTIVHTCQVRDIAESTQVNECGAGCCGGKKKKDKKKKKKDIDEVYDIVKELQLKTLIDESEADVTFIYDESVDNIVDSEVYSDLCEALDTLDEIDYEVDDQDPSCLAVWEK